MKQEMPWILAVDDDPAMLAIVGEILEPFYRVEAVGTVKEAQRRFGARPYDLVLTDMVMPEMGGMDLVKHVRLHYPETPVIVFTGFANVQEAVQAVKLGAFDYLPKPVAPEFLRHAIGRALEFKRLVQGQRDLEIILEGAEALGWQVMELLADTPRAAVLAALREVGPERRRPPRGGATIPGRCPGKWSRPPAAPFSSTRPPPTSFTGWRPWGRRRNPGSPSPCP